MKIIVAIDPGLTGAIAFYIPEQNRMSVYDMPVMGSEVNPAELRHMLDVHRPDIAVIERVGPMPRDGVMQAWRFSATFAVAKTVVTLQSIPLMLATPAQWKKAMHVAGGPAGKEQCRQKAIQMFPANAEAFARKKDAGRAEAALLAVYAESLSNKEGGRSPSPL